MAALLRRLPPLGASILEVCKDMDQWNVLGWSSVSSTVLTVVGLGGMVQRGLS
jgi:hypothetical protein